MPSVSDAKSPKIANTKHDFACTKHKSFYVKDRHLFLQISDTKFGKQIVGLHKGFWINPKLFSYNWMYIVYCLIPSMFKMRTKLIFFMKKKNGHTANCLSNFINIANKWYKHGITCAKWSMLYDEFTRICSFKLYYTYTTTVYATIMTRSSYYFIIFIHFCSIDRLENVCNVCNVCHYKFILAMLIMLHEPHTGSHWST